MPAPIDPGVIAVTPSHDKAQLTRSSRGGGALRVGLDLRRNENYLRHPPHTNFFEDVGPPRGILSAVKIYDSLNIPD